MKSLFTLVLLYSLWSIASDSIEVKGTLFKKNETWLLSVQNDKATFKKGTLELKSVPSTMSKFLVEQSYVQIRGETASCTSKRICLEVKVIKPALLDPLSRRR